MNSRRGSLENCLVGEGFSGEVLQRSQQNCRYLGVPMPSKQLNGMDSLLFTVQMPKGVLQEVTAAAPENDVLKRLTRRRRVLVDEKSRVLSRMQSDLQAVCPRLLAITNDADNVWFLNFLTYADDLTKMARLYPKTVSSIQMLSNREARKPYPRRWCGVMHIFPPRIWPTMPNGSFSSAQNWHTRQRRC